MSETERKRYYRKKQNLWAMVAKIKLWPSRNGILHGVRSITKNGALASIITHCGETLLARDSRNSRAARWLRSKQYATSCKKCVIPNWKIEKYGSTVFSKRQGGVLPDSLGRDK